MDDRIRKICFVVSAPRSGSTWLKKALNRHPEIFCTENRLFGLFDEVSSENDGSKILRITLDRYVTLVSSYFEHEALGLQWHELRDRLLPHMIESLFSFAAEISGKQVIVDKITPHADTSEQVLWSIRQYLPKAAIVQLIRDGRDVLTSGVFDWIARSSGPKERHDFFVHERKGARLDRFFQDDEIEAWTILWTQPIAAMSASGGVDLDIRYEEMKLDQSGVLRGLFGLLRVDDSSEIADECVRESTFEKMSGGRAAGQAIATAKARKGVVGDWRNYFTRQDGELFHELAGDRLIELGYEKDRSWIEQLPRRLDLRRK